MEGVTVAELNDHSFCSSDVLDSQMGSFQGRALFLQVVLNCLDFHIWTFGRLGLRLDRLPCYAQTSKQLLQPQHPGDCLLQTVPVGVVMSQLEKRVCA